MKNPAALPRKEKFHKAAGQDEDWWFRRHGSGKNEDGDGGFPYYEANSLSKKNFNRGSLNGEHSRKLFSQMTQGRSHSEGSLLAIREDPNARKKMANKYKQVMMGLPGAPGHTHAALHAITEETESPAPPPGASWLGSVGSKQPSAPSGTPARGSKISSQMPLPPGSKISAITPLISRGPSSHLSACAPLGRGDGSQLSACAPLGNGRLSQLSANPPGVRSQLSANAPYMGNSICNEFEAPSAVSLQPPESNVTASDFFSWRPRLVS